MQLWHLYWRIPVLQDQTVKLYNFRIKSYWACQLPLRDDLLYIDGRMIHNLLLGSVLSSSSHLHSLTDLMQNQSFFILVYTFWNLVLGGTCSWIYQPVQTHDKFLVLLTFHYIAHSNLWISMTEYFLRISSLVNGSLRLDLF